MFTENQNYIAEYYKGWLIITDKASNKTSPVQLLSTETGRNITKKQFNDSVKKFGLDKACESFQRLAATYKFQQCYS